MALRNGVLFDVDWYLPKFGPYEHHLAESVPRGGILYTDQGVPPASPLGPLYFNRGTNTGAGPSVVYWTTENEADPNGLLYPAPDPFGVPFSQLTNIVTVFVLDR